MKYTEPRNPKGSKWNEKSEEEKQAIKEKISASQKARLAKRTLEQIEKKRQQQRDYMNNRSEEEKEQAKLKRQLTYKNKSEEELERIKQQRIKSCKQTWANKSEEELKEFGRKQSIAKNSYSEEKKQEVAQKKRDWWKQFLDNMTQEEREHFDNVRKRGWINYWNNLSEDEKQKWRDNNKYLNECRWSNATPEYILKHSEKCKEVYWSMSEEKRKLMQQHRNETYRKNNTYGTSKIEDDIYEQLIKHKELSVKRQSILNGYKYDFVIIKDNIKTYIEINGVFWHNYRPFKECEEHIKEYEEMYSKSPRQKHIAEIWRYKDVEKYNYCVRNNINFIRLYIDKFDLNECINFILKNISKGQVTML